MKGGTAADGGMVGCVSFRVADLRATMAECPEDGNGEGHAASAASTPLAAGGAKP
jgi:hypothetical protein